MESALKSDKSQSLVTASGMRLIDVGAIFYLLLIGLGLAAVVFVTEVLIGALIMRSKRPPRRRNFQN